MKNCVEGGRVMLERFSSVALNVLRSASREASALHVEAVGTVHLLLGIANEESSVGAIALSRFGIDAREIRKLIPKPLPTQGKSHIPLSTEARKALDEALVASKRAGNATVTTGHLLVGLASSHDETTTFLLQNHGVAPASLAKSSIVELEETSEPVIARTQTMATVSGQPHGSESSAILLGKTSLRRMREDARERD